MKLRIIGLISTAIFATALTACGSSTQGSYGGASTSSATTQVASTTTTNTPGYPDTSASTTTSSSGATTTTTTGSAKPTVVLTDSKLGKILTTADGRTLYMFTPDTADSSVCNGGCAQAWPAFVTPATPGDGLTATNFSTIKRTDGSTQVTFAGHPLYTYAGDSKSGDTNGQGSGGKWFALTAQGTKAG